MSGRRDSRLRDECQHQARLLVEVNDMKFAAVRCESQLQAECRQVAAHVVEKK